MSFWDFKPHIKIKHKSITIKYCNPFSDIMLNPDIASFSEEEQFNIIKNCIRIYKEKWDDNFRMKFITGYTYKRNTIKSIEFDINGRLINLINKFEEKDFVL